MRVLHVRPYPDELLYSIAAREREYLGLVEARRALSAVFGNGMKVVSADFLNVPHVEQSASGEQSLLGAELLQSHTLMPYYMSVLPANRRATVGKVWGAPRHRLSYVGLGLPASSVRLPSYLRLCPLCVESDLRIRGETYWRRHHQLPGVGVCVEHQALLVETAVLMRPTNRHQLTSARARLLEGAQATLEETAVNHPCASWVAAESFALVRGEAPDFGPQVRAALAARFPKRCRSEVDRLRDLIREVFSPAFLAWCERAFNVGLEGAWLAYAVLRPERLTHPLRYLLIHGALQQTSATRTKPQTALWRCPNRLAPHYRRRVAERTSRLPGSGEVVYRYECRCGMRFSAIELPGNELLVRRIIEWGALYEAAAQRYKREGKGLRAIGRELNVDPKTVRLLLRPTASAPEPPNPAELKARRAEWTSALENTGNSVKVARNSKPACYAWLYRNDRSWLAGLSKSRAAVRTVRPRVDWDKRDAELRSRIGEVVSLLQSAEPAARITTTGIGALVGKRSHFAQLLQKLPMSRELVTASVESVEEFRARRIKAASTRWQEQGERPARWELLRAVGLDGKRLSPRLEKLVTNACGL